MNSTHPLAEFVPSKDYQREYISREVNGIRDLDILRAAHRLHKNVLFEGPTGSSKTSIVYAYAASLDMPIVSINCNGNVDIKQLLGGWSPTTDGTWDFTPGHLVVAAMHGAVILFDEINFLPPKMASVAYSLLDKRRTVYLPDAVGSSFPSVFTAHPDTMIVGGMNPGYIGTRPLNQALRNRFAIQLDWGYNVEVEKQLVVSHALIDLASKLRQRAEVGDLMSPVPTNALMEFEEFAQDDNLGMEFAIENFASRFDADERRVVREVIALHRPSIEAQLFGTAAAEGVSL